MDILSAATMLFLIMDPLGNLPVMLSILKHLDPKRRRVVLVRELCFALIILMLFLFAGKNIMGFLHVQPETLSISGGIILFIISIKMIFPSAGSITGLAAGEEPFIVPMAIPMIAGPGSIATTMLLMARNDGLERTFVVLAAMATILLLTLLSLLAAGPLMRMLGARIEAVITRLLGVLLAALAVQFVIDGLQVQLR